MVVKVKRADLIYPDLSYKIFGCAFDVSGEIGGGHHEKVYQRALATSFKRQGLKFQEQVYYPIRYQGEFVGKGFFDFLVEGKVVVELKKGNRYSKSHIDQVLAYLRANHLRLAIIINFARDGADCRRIVNFIP